MAIRVPTFRAWNKLDANLVIARDGAHVKVSAVFIGLPENESTMLDVFIGVLDQSGALFVAQ